MNLTKNDTELLNKFNDSLNACNDLDASVIEQVLINCLWRDSTCKIREDMESVIEQINKLNEELNNNEK